MNTWWFAYDDEHNIVGYSDSSAEGALQDAVRHNPVEIDPTKIKTGRARISVIAMTDLLGGNMGCWRENWVRWGFDGQGIAELTHQG